MDRGTPTFQPDLFVPKVGSFLTIDLPGERTRATVRRVVDADTVLVDLTTMPMAKSHQYRFHDILAVRRTTGTECAAPGSPETWSVVEERRVLPQTMETEHAPQAGVEPKHDLSKHPRNGRQRSSAKSSGGGKSQQLKATSKRARRSGRAAKSGRSGR